MARRLELSCVATGNVHAHARARGPLQDAFVALRLHTTLDASEPDRRGNFSHVLAPPAAMAARFPEYPEAVAETVRLAESLEFDLCSDLTYSYPGAEDPLKLRELSQLCGARLHERYARPAGGAARGRGRRGSSRSCGSSRSSTWPASSCSTMRCSSWRARWRSRCAAAGIRSRPPATRPRAMLPPGRGRGSSVSSIVCYLTGLSHVDPIANELAIGRFLSEDLKALPDIDLDFPRDIREVLIPRVSERFGKDRAALVAAFPTYRARGAIRELGKVLGLPPGEIERVARGSEGWDARGVGRDIETASGGAPLRRSLGLARAAGGAGARAAPASEPAPGRDDRRHAAADRLLPGGPGGDGGALHRAVGQGLVRRRRLPEDRPARARDALGGRALRRADRQDAWGADRPQPHPARGPRDLPRDPARRDHRRLPDREPRADAVAAAHAPENLKDIAIQVAIVRPGPIQGGAVNPYIERRQRLRVDPDYQIPYEHPSLEPALRETLGAIIFQDQVLEVASAFAGFRPGEAEDLRRAMSRKRSEAAIEAHHQRFVEGAMRLHGVDAETAERVFEKVKGFSGFGFPKSHAAAFGLLAYQSTWLRVHYGPEFLCALLNEQPMGFYPPDALVHEAQRRGLEVVAPDVNRSDVECSLDDEGRVLIGLGYIRGVRRTEIEALVAERERSGPFTSLSQLASRAGAGAPGAGSAGLVGCRATRWREHPGGGPRLATAARALAARAPPRLRTASAAVGRSWRCRSSCRRRRRLPELSAWETLLADYGTLGMTVASHPMALLRSRLPDGCKDSRDLARLAHGSRVRIGGLVVARQRPRTAGGCGVRAARG